MRLKTRSILLLVLLLLVPVLGACGSDDDPAVEGDDAATTEPADEKNTVAIKAADYSFDGPAEMKGGLVTFEFSNTGKEPHQAQLTLLPAGKTISDLAAAYQPEGPPATWMKAHGGPQVGAGATTTYTANVAAGDYAIVCLIPGPEGKPHVALGMIAPLKVTAGEDGDLPEADVTLTAKDFEFGGVETLKAGKQTVKVDNQGPSEHEWVVAELQPGKTAKDLMAEGDGGPPPIVAVPGVAAPMQAGESAVATVEMKAGPTYVIACFVFDPAKKAPHVALGMLKEFKVT